MVVAGFESAGSGGADFRVSAIDLDSSAASKGLATSELAGTLGKGCDCGLLPLEAVITAAPTASGVGGSLGIDLGVMSAWTDDGCTSLGTVSPAGATAPGGAGCFRRAVLLSVPGKTTGDDLALALLLLLPTFGLPGIEERGIWLGLYGDVESAYRL